MFIKKADNEKNNTAIYFSCMREDFDISLHQVCHFFNISRSAYYNSTKYKDDSEVIEQLSELAKVHYVWYWWRCFLD